MNMCTQGEPGIFSHVSMMGLKNDPSLCNRKWMCYTLFNQLCIQCAVCVIFTLRKLDMCSKLPLPSLIFLFWASGYTYTQSRSFCPWCCSCEKKYQGLEGMRLLHPHIDLSWLSYLECRTIASNFFFGSTIRTLVLARHLVGHYGAFWGFILLSNYAEMSKKYDNKYS